MYNETVPLYVPNQVLKMPLMKNNNPVVQKFDYEKGGNNLIVEPQIAKFAGFEVGKLNILKIKVINKASKSQRIYVLPPQSSFFSVKFDKKGLLASGMAEEIYIHFQPNEYKYYYDTIKINSENDTILVPIHAYPAINRDNLRELFPRLIDFGVVEIGQTESYRYTLQCKIPLNFEFEFAFIKDHPDMKITPSKGILPGRGTVEIEITYQPTMKITVVVETELKLSQFDFEPLQIKIMGSGKYALNNQKSLKPTNQKLKSLNEDNKNKVDLLNSQLDEMGEQEQSPKLLDNTHKTEGYVAPNEQFKTLIKSVNSKQANYSIRKSVINYNDKETNEKKVDVTSKPIQMNNSQLNQKQGRQQLEKAYLDHFNQVAQLDKDKEIRFFQCIGDFPITTQNIELIQKERDQFTKKTLQEQEQQGITRYEIKYNEDCAVIEQVLPKNECQWDFDKNDTIKISRIKRKKFVNAVTQVIYRIRFDNKIQKIRAFLKGAKNREQVKKMVNQDWQKAEYAGVGKKDFVQFQFEFEENNLGKFLLPVQFSQSNNFSSFRFDINPRTGFDDWAPIEQIPNCDQEIMQYKNWDYPQLVFHPPLQQSLIFRTGAEEEFSVRSRMGPFNKIINTQDDKMRSLLAKPCEVESFRLLEPHRTLKYMHSYEENNPFEPHYYTTFTKVENIGADFDPDVILGVQILKQEFMNRSPGYSNIPLIFELNLENDYYQEKNILLSYDYGFERETDQYCPDLMAAKDYDDNLTDDDSDGEGPPQLQVQDLEEFLKKIEQDDNNILSLKGEVIDHDQVLEKLINKNQSEEKQKWTSTMPSKTADYNKFTQSNTNKLIIL